MQHMNTHLEFDRTIRIAVIRSLIERGRAPEAHELAADYDCSLELVEASLTRLHEHHGLVLHPHSHRVWLAHPFSTAPTHFFVERAGDGRMPAGVAPNGKPAAGGLAPGHAASDSFASVDNSDDFQAPRGWWANCAKCAMGIVALLGGNARIHTRIAAEAEPLTLEFRNNAPATGDIVMHVALPVSRWWENVSYTCSTILFFRDERQVAAWSTAHGINHGAILSLDQAWGLARQWYGNAAGPEWRRKTAAEAAALFESLGLIGEFWAVPPNWK
mgnify:CR=1 FL=1